MAGKHEHTLTLKYKKSSGGYVGFCAEFPSVVVQSPTKTGLKKEVKVALDGYFKAFPEEHEINFANDLEADDVIIEV